MPEKSENIFGKRKIQLDDFENGEIEIESKVKNKNIQVDDFRSSRISHEVEIHPITIVNRTPYNKANIQQYEVVRENLIGRSRYLERINDINDIPLPRVGVGYDDFYITMEDSKGNAVKTMVAGSVIVRDIQIDDLGMFAVPIEHCIFMGYGSAENAEQRYRNLVLLYNTLNIDQGINGVKTKVIEKSYKRLDL